MGIGISTSHDGVQGRTDSNVQLDFGSSRAFGETLLKHHPTGTSLEGDTILQRQNIVQSIFGNRFWTCCLTLTGQRSPQKRDSDAYNLQGSPERILTQFRFCSESPLSCRVGYKVPAEKLSGS